jgi:hypothetical protein
VRKQVLSSDRYDLTYEIQSVTRGAYRVVSVERPDARRVRSGRTCESGRPDLCCAVSPMALFAGGLLYKLVGRL